MTCRVWRVAADDMPGVVPGVKGCMPPHLDVEQVAVAYCLWADPDEVLGGIRAGTAARRWGASAVQGGGR